MPKSASLSIADPAAALKQQGKAEDAADVKAARKSAWKAIPLEKGKPKPTTAHADERAARYKAVEGVR